MTETRIINKKTPRQFSIVDRAMIRDTRLSADAKNIYTVLSSLAETCENTCPSYRWLAQEVGYKLIDDETLEEKSERAINKWVSSKIQELIQLQFVIQINRIGASYDYEIYDYNPEQKSSVPLNKKVPSPLNKKVPLVIREEKEDISNKKSIKKETEVSALPKIEINNLEEIKEKLEVMQTLIDRPLIPKDFVLSLAEILKDKSEAEHFATFVKEKKSKDLDYKSNFLSSKIYTQSVVTHYFNWKRKKKEEVEVTIQNQKLKTPEIQVGTGEEFMPYSSYQEYLQSEKYNSDQEFKDEFKRTYFTLAPAENQKQIA